MIDNRIVNDKRLSYRARGVLLYLLSKPVDWNVYQVEVEKNGKEGREAISAAFEELINLGYIKGRPRKDSETGRMKGWVYHVHEEPVSGWSMEDGSGDARKKNTSKAKDGKPKSGSPINGKPSPNNKKVNNTEINNPPLAPYQGDENSHLPVGEDVFETPLEHQGHELIQVIFDDQEADQEHQPNQLSKVVTEDLSIGFVDTPCSDPGKPWLVGMLTKAILPLLTICDFDFYPYRCTCLLKAYYNMLAF